MQQNNQLYFYFLIILNYIYFVLEHDLIFIFHVIQINI